MKILIFWDIYGRVGRNAIVQEFSKLRSEYEADFSIANIENITSGRGPIEEHARKIANLWIDAMTWGDHIFDNKDAIVPYFQSRDCALIRPANFYQYDSFTQVGEGYKIFEKNGVRILLIQLLWETFMSHRVDNPFHMIDQILEKIPRESYDISILDFHRETTSEIAAMAHFLDGRISLVYGTHTHVQTSDAGIFPGGTAMISDVGMNGPAYSVIWADFSSVKGRFLSGIQRGKIEQQLGKDFCISALLCEIDELSGKALKVQSIFYRGSLK